MSFIWAISNDGTNFTQMKSPYSYKIDWEDLDNESYRSVTNGNLIRDVITRRWAKIGLSWNCIFDHEIKPILEGVNQSNLWVRCISPAFGSGMIEFKAYVSKMSVELYQGTVYNTPAYKLSFNIIQSEVASWQ